MGGRGGGGGGRRASAASDLRYNMEITLEEAFTGKTAQIRVPTSVTCEACSRHRRQGRAPSPKTCPTCGGHGQVRAQQGFFTVERTCPTCQGRGQIIEDPCPSCGGAGPRDAGAHAVGQHPAGRRGRHPHPPGRRRRGRPARRAAGRPLHLPRRCKPHAFFQRDGADLFCRVPISMTTAALGGEIEVPTHRRRQGQA